MLTIDPIVLKNPNRVADWISKNPDRFVFLMDTLFMMRDQYPEQGLVVELEDDDVLCVASSDEHPFRFHYSDYRKVAESFEAYRDDSGYKSFVERYTRWCKEFQEWWYGYQRFAELISSTGASEQSVVRTS